MSGTVGLKRKLEEEDEDDPEKQPKLEEWRKTAKPEEPHLAHFLQRQAVLQLSLQKLCGHFNTALLRRVLITNTLKFIQQELSIQGGSITTQAQIGAPQINQGNGVDAEGSLTPAWVLEQDGELFLSLQSSVISNSGSSITRMSPKDSSSDVEDLCPSLAMQSSTTSSSSSSSTSQLDFQYSFEKNNRIAIAATEILEKETQNESSSNGHCDSAHSSSSICLPELSLDDFLFSDIDNFLCEMNPCPPNPSLAQDTSSSKVTSMVTDDLVRSLTNQPFRTDLNELDHIMEVLVGS